MIRLHVIAEGQTEQTFVGKVLAPHLAVSGIVSYARCVLTSKDKRAGREYRGGLINYQKAKSDILTWMKEDNNSECRFTSMFDLYALPDDFPGYSEAGKQSNAYERVKILEDAFAADINHHRFIPYIQMHEFEALILVDPQQLDWEYLDHAGPIRRLIEMVGAQNPELINDGRETAPSKRILNEISEYDKVSAGVSVVGKIGLLKLRENCQHFNEWLTRLEKLTEVNV